MAKFVIAGKSNCPYFARAELVADTLARNLPDFKVHKIMKNSDEWNDWLQHTCQKNNWKHTKSPIIWRELVDRGGKAMLLGDVNDFLEYSKGYYGISTELTSEDLRKISSENESTYNIIQKEHERERENHRQCIVTITNPENPVLNFILPDILNRNIFGSNEITVRLFSTTNDMDRLNGLRMEIEDLASSKLSNIKIFNRAEEAFLNADFVILFDELKRSNEEDAEIYINPYIELAESIEEYAKRTCKILITPLESKSEIFGLINVFSQHLKLIDSRTNLIGNSMCEEMIAKSLLAQRLKVNPAYVKDVILVGQSLQDTYYIDISKSKVTNYDGAVWARQGTHWLNLVNMIADKDWIHKDFLASVHERERKINEKLQRDGVYTFAQSVIKILQLWNSEKSDGNLYSVIANLNGHYSIDEDVFLSVPTKFENGSYIIDDNFFQTNSLISEISKVKKLNLSISFLFINYELKKDAIKRIKDRYKKDIFVKDTEVDKMSIQNVKID